MRTWIAKQLFQVFSGLCQKRKGSRPKRCANIERQAKFPREEKNWLSKDYTKLRQTRSSNIVKREIQMLLESQRLQQQQAN